MLRINMTRTTPVSLVMNVPSDKLGRKDVLKVEDRELNQEELDRLALIAPTASIAQPKPLSKVWLCHGDRKMSTDHTGHSNPDGGPMGQPMMKVATRNQFW